MGVGAGLDMYDVIVKTFTFSISSTNDFLLTFCIRGVHWRHLANMAEPSVCGGDAALRQITLTTCCNNYR